MVQQIIPQGQTQGMMPNDPFMQVLDKLAQALGGISQTQQEILTRLQDQKKSPDAGVKIAPSFPANSNPTVQYNWLYAYGLAYNFDGTRKVQQVTAKDVDDHQKMLEKFGTMYRIFK